MSTDDNLFTVEALEATRIPDPPPYHAWYRFCPYCGKRIKEAGKEKTR